MLSTKEREIWTKQFWQNIAKVVTVVRKRELVIDRSLPENSILGSDLPYHKRKWRE
jgi:hypothetical protein